MLYQLINETLVKQFPNVIEIDGIVYTNADAVEKARESGEWFELEILEQPEYNQETEYLTRRYYQEGDIIYLDWDIHEIEEVEDAGEF